MSKRKYIITFHDEKWKVISLEIIADNFHHAISILREDYPGAEIISYVERRLE